MKIPGPIELSAAWVGLTPFQRDYIGFIALEMVFQGFLSGQAHAPEDHVLKSDDDCGEAFDRECKRLSELYRTIEDALPDLFGPEGEDPAWASQLSGASPVQNGVSP